MGERAEITAYSAWAGAKCTAAVAGDQRVVAVMTGAEVSVLSLENITARFEAARLSIPAHAIGDRDSWDAYEAAQRRAQRAGGKA